MFRVSELPFPELTVLTRSRDTPQRERQRMPRHPLEILIATPESLPYYFPAMKVLQFAFTRREDNSFLISNRYFNKNLPSFPHIQ